MPKGKTTFTLRNIFLKYILNLYNTKKNKIVCFCYKNIGRWF